jgi:hypothetical protein
VGCGEGLGQQDHRSGVDRPVGVEHRGVQRAERAVAAAAGVVADQDVQVPEGTGRGVDQLSGRGRVGEVQSQVVDRGIRVGQGFGDSLDDGLRAAGVGSPGLGVVVRGVVVQEDAGTQGGQATGDRVADADAPAGAGHHSGPAFQGQRIASQLVGGGIGVGHGRQLRGVLM